MAKEKTPSSRLVSKHGGGYITVGQRAAEIVCENIARWKKIKLNPKFWNEARWKNTYLKQVQVAYRILQRYDADILISVLSENQFICTLMNKKLYALLNKKRDNKPQSVEVSDNPKSGQAFNPRSSLMDKLD